MRKFAFPFFSILVIGILFIFPRHASSAINIVYEVMQTEVDNANLFIYNGSSCKNMDRDCVNTVKRNVIIDAVKSKHNIDNEDTATIIWDGFAPISGTVYAVTKTVLNDGKERFVGRTINNLNIKSAPIPNTILQCNNGKFDANLLFSLSTVRSTVGDRWKVVLWKDDKKKEKIKDYCTPRVFLSY